MTDVSADLRKWLNSLDETNLGMVLVVCDSLRVGARLPLRSSEVQSSSKRETRAARMWVARASVTDLTEVATSVLPVATDLLVLYHKFEKSVVANPDFMQLAKMLSALGHPLNRLALFGLLLGHFPASELAARRRTELETAIELSSRQQLPRELLLPVRTSQAERDIKSPDARKGGRREQDSPTRIYPECGIEAVSRAEEHLANLREYSLTAAALLQSSAGRLEGGLAVSDDLAAMLDRLADLRTELLRFFETIAEVDPEAPLQQLSQVLKIARESIDSQRHTAERDSRIEELDKQIDELKRIVASSPPETRQLLGLGLDALLAERAGLSGDDSAAGRSEAEPVPIEPVPEKSQREKTERAFPKASAVQESAVRVDASSNQERIVQTQDDQEQNVTPATQTGVDATPVDSIPVLVDEVSADELEQGFPWEEGDPPLAVNLTATGRLAEAYWVTAMSGEPDRRAAVLRFASAAYTVSNSSDATAVLAAVDLDFQTLSQDTDAAILATTAMLRAGLTAGWGHSMLGQLRAESTLPVRWATLLNACVAAVRRGYRVDYGISVQPLSDDGQEARLELGKRAAALLQDLPRGKTSYQRASRVLQRLTATGQPLAVALDTVIAWSSGEAKERALPSVAAALNVPGSVENLIHEADVAMRTPKQAKEPIVATALRTLTRAVDEVRTIVSEADALDRRLTAAESDAAAAVDQQLSTAVREVTGEEQPPGMVGAALVLLRSWMLDPSAMTGSTKIAGLPSVGVPDGIDEPGTDVLLALTDLSYDADGRPDRTDPRTPEVLARLADPIDLNSALSVYCERGDLRRASRIVELAEQGIWNVAGETAALRNVVNAASQRWAKEYSARVHDARGLFARVRVQNLLDQAEETAVAGRLEARAAVSEGAYDEASARLSELVETLSAKQEYRIRKLREDLDGQEMADGDRSRVLALLDDDDTVTATEFIAFVRAGQPLPEHASSAVRDIKTFTKLLAGARDKLTDPQTGARAWASVSTKQRPLTEVGGAGVAAWDSLSDSSSHTGDRLTVAVKDILRTLGLRCEVRPREISQRGARGFRKFRVQGVPSDGSYVSVLGSAAVEYTVTVVVEERRGRSVLDVLGQEDSGRANVILYLYTMDLAARRSLAVQATNSQAQAMVVDPAVLGWVAATAPGSWRATQRVTLPWTALDPYRPFVAGLVPPEVFFGRTKEISEVTDPLGGLFVYGGRQLGKSALLRRVEATFHDEHQHAVYIDLKGRGIGEAEPASRIWRELVVQLKHRGVLDQRVSDDAPSDVVVDHVRRWFEVHPARRLLLLADEADAFLTADSRGIPTTGGVAHFPNVLRLKELMESTKRRFKVVFAGLHQVQRFGHLSNVPLVHGGPDILIGPLDPSDAAKLVTEPMSALGYTFERPELVWRLLSATNYQAGLIQIFCQELMRTLRDRVKRTQSALVPITVTEDDIEVVAAGDRVRSRIAERLRITINLEDRYRVLTLVIALLSLKDSFSADYGPDQLLDQARERWPAGFDDLTASQVSIYLDEMVGLGLLVKLSGRNRYAVRSPNVVNMLGTAADLDRELRETDFDLPYEYNPREARRLLTTTQGRECRSPLTDGQLSELTSRTAASGKGVMAVSVVTGTDALGIDRVVPAIKNYAEMRGNRVETAGTAAEVTKTLSLAGRRSKPTILVADLRGRDDAELERVTSRLAKAPGHSILLVSPADANTASDRLGVKWRRPERWTASSLRSWPECPFDVPSDRADLIRATGGWPVLVERAIALVVAQGRTKQQALELVYHLFDDQARAAKQLSDVGLSQEVINRIGPWVDWFEPGDSTSPADVAVALEQDLAAMNRLLGYLENLGILDEAADGLVLDVVVHRCLKTVRDAP